MADSCRVPLEKLLKRIKGFPKRIAEDNIVMGATYNGQDFRS